MWIENDFSLAKYISEEAMNSSVNKFPPNLFAALLDSHRENFVQIMAANDYALASKVHGDTFINAISELIFNKYSHFKDLIQYDEEKHKGISKLFKYILTKNLLEGIISYRDVRGFASGEFCSQKFMPECMVTVASPGEIQALIKEAEDHTFMYALILSMVKENSDDEISLVTYKAALDFSRELYIIHEVKPDLELIKAIKDLSVNDFLTLLKKLDNYPEHVASNISGILCARISELFMQPDRLPVDDALEMTKLLFDKINVDTISDLEFILHTLAARRSIELEIPVDADPIIQSLLKKLKPYQKEGLTFDERLKALGKNTDDEENYWEDIDFLIECIDREADGAEGTRKKPRV